MLIRQHIYSFYPNVEFQGSECLGNGAYNTCYQVCDYCKEYEKIYILNRPVYYNKGAKRKLVSYCIGCYDLVNKGGGGRLTIAGYKHGGYYEVLDAIKDSGAVEVISFEEAVKAAFNRTHNISEDGVGAESGVSMLKRYLGCYRVKDNNIFFDDKRLWEFRYKLQYEEPRVKVVNSNEGEGTLLLTWNKDYVEEEQLIPID